jgi:hypothetical protein
MAQPVPVRLAHGNWLAALRMLSFCCADIPRDASRRARELNHLLGHAPDGSLVEGMLALGLVRLEAMLAADAAEAAIMAMFQPGASYMLSRAGDGQSLATVALPSPHREQSSAGATPALALIGAVALSLADGSVSMHVAARRVALDGRALLH